MQWEAVCKPYSSFVGYAAWWSLVGVQHVDIDYVMRVTVAFRFRPILPKKHNDIEIT